MFFKRLFDRITGRQAKLAAQVRDAFETMPDDAAATIPPPSVSTMVTVGSADPSALVDGDMWLLEINGAQTLCMYQGGAIRRMKLT